jgi:hypothetical protein
MLDAPRYTAQEPPPEEMSPLTHTQQPVAVAHAHPDEWVAVLLGGVSGHVIRMARGDVFVCLADEVSGVHRVAYP